jgi:hypothetical protein
MKTRRKAFLTAIAASAGLVFGGPTASAQPSPPPLTPEQIKQIVASPDRSAADRTNDLRRKPEEMLLFIGIHPGITALDLSAAGGYTTELLARAIGPVGHRLRPEPAARSQPAANAAGRPEGNSHPTAAVRPPRRPPPPPGAPRPRPAPWPIGTAHSEKQKSRPPRSPPSCCRSSIPFRPNSHRSIS